MSCADIPQIKLRLAEAELAYHQLQTGKKVATVTFGPSKSVSYTAANMTDLLRYINDLKDKIADCEGRKGRRMIRWLF